MNSKLTAESENCLHPRLNGYRLIQRVISTSLVPTRRSCGHLACRIPPQAVLRQKY